MRLFLKKDLSVIISLFASLAIFLWGYLFYFIGVVQAECADWNGSQCGTEVCFAYGTGMAQTCEFDELPGGGVQCVNRPNKCCSTENECLVRYPRPTNNQIIDASVGGCGYMNNLGGCVVKIDERPIFEDIEVCQGPDNPQLCCVTGGSYIQNQFPDLATNTCAQQVASVSDAGLVRNTTEVIAFEICNQAGTASKISQCQACVGTGTETSKSKVWTAIGCIDTSREGIVGAIVRLALGLSGGIVLLKILAASLKISMSKGEPKEVEEAREEITNAIIGVLFIVFSIVLVQFIGIDLLQIPGF